MDKDKPSNSDEIAKTNPSLDGLAMLQKQIQEQANNPAYKPFCSAYKQSVIDQYKRDFWTVEQAANLLAGCVSFRPSNLVGEEHKNTNYKVSSLSATIENCIGRTLTRAEGKGFFKKNRIYSSEIVDWALSKDIDVPSEMIRESGKAQTRTELFQYSTPELEAVLWTVRNFWEGVEIKDVPNQQEVTKAIRKQFPSLSEDACLRVDRVTRHPSKKVGRPKIK